MNLKAIDDLSAADAKRHLRELIEDVTRPAFGVLPTREYDLRMFRLMREIGVLKPDGSLYYLMTHLRVSRAKARNLMFELEIRDAPEPEDLDAQVRDAIARPRGFAEDGKYLVLGIENPVIQAHLKDTVRELGHITDASFDSTLIRITPKALAALVEKLMSDDDKSDFRAAMVAAGYDRDESLETALIEGLKHVAAKAVGEPLAGMAEGYVKDLGALLMPHARRLKDRLVGLLTSIRATRRKAEEPIRPEGT
ncbi:MAG: hypothetical protein AAFR35_05180 [Pseudomonadota bacterium]